MRTGQALAGVATISPLHERGMGHSGLRNGYLALSREGLAYPLLVRWELLRPGRCNAARVPATCPERQQPARRGVSTR
jgi:hypothetical protein